MSESLVDALEECLGALARNPDVETCLARYPELAEELRPLLMAAIDAQGLATSAASPEAMRRGKSRLLNQAAEMREQGLAAAGAGTAPLARFSRGFRIAVASLAAVLLTFLAGGVGLGYASSSALPGDRLYPIKIKWEGAQLQLAGSAQAQQALQAHFEQERLAEVGQLIAVKRAEDVNFVGTVSAVFPDRLTVSGIKVLLGQQSKVEGQLALDEMVRVRGHTQPDGAVLASEVKVVNAPSEDLQNPVETPEPTANSPRGSVTSTPPTPEPSEEATAQSHQSFELEGTVSSMENGSIVVAGNTIVLTSSTQVHGNLAQGVTVRVRGYVNADGTLIATRVQVSGSGQGQGGGNAGGRATPTPTSGSGGGGGEDDDGGSVTPTPTSSSGGGGGNHNGGAPTPTPSSSGGD